MKKKTHPKTGHQCEGRYTTGKREGERCTNDASVRVGEHWYCQGHRPDKL